MEYPEDTRVFVLATRDGRFACLVELSIGRRWAYAFTSQEKAIDFIRAMRGGGLPEDADRVYLSTLKEWFDRQAKEGLPDLAIDADPAQLRSYPLRLGIDLSTSEVQCVTRDTPGGNCFEVLARQRRRSAPP